MSLIKSNMTAPPPAAGGGGGPLSSIGEMNSLRFDGSSNLYRNFQSGNRQTFTWSGWAKRSEFTSTEPYCLFGSYQSSLGNNNNSWFLLSFYENQLFVNGWGAHWRRTEAVYRDPSAWYHVVCAVNSTLAAEDDRIRIFVNGSEIVDFQSKINPAQNFEFAVNVASSEAHGIGDIVNFPTKYYANGFLANIHFVDGQALTSHYFGAEVSGTWVPKPFDGTSSDSTYNVSGASHSYGANGFHLEFSTKGGHTIQNVGGGNVQLNTSSTSSFLETPVPSNLSSTNQALTFVNNGNLEVSPFVPLSGDFTLEAWISRKSGITAPMKAFWLSCSSHTDNPSFYFNDGHTYTTWWWPANYSHEPMDRNDNSWEHVAWVRESGTVNFYRNGVQKSAPVTMPDTVGADWIKIGNDFQGGMNHIRISNNARYSGASIADWQNTTHSFTPDSNTMLLITDQNNIDSMTFVDQAGNAGIDIGYDSSGNNNHWNEN